MTKNKRFLVPHLVTEGDVKSLRESVILPPARVNRYLKEADQGSAKFRAYQVWWKALPDYRPIVAAPSRGRAKKYIQDVSFSTLASRLRKLGAKGGACLRLGLNCA